MKERVLGFKAYNEIANIESSYMSYVGHVL